MPDSIQILANHLTESGIRLRGPSSSDIIDTLARMTSSIAVDIGNLAKLDIQEAAAQHNITKILNVSGFIDAGLKK